jgi:hypothetical protein
MGRTCSTYKGWETAYSVLVEKPEGYHLEDPVVDGRAILKRIFKKWDGEARTGLIWLKIRTGGVVL